MSVILSVDTSTPACSVALNIDGVVLEDFRMAPRMHNDLILPMVDQILSQAELTLSQVDAIAFGRGPGSFTGLRIAAGVVQGLAYGADLPVIPVSTLEAMALDAYRKYKTALWLPALDARMGEIYVAGYRVFEEEGMTSIEALLPESVVKPDALDDLNDAFNGVGSGWCYKEVLLTKIPTTPNTIDIDIAPRAACIAELAGKLFAKNRMVPVYEAMPSYLRDEISWEKQPLKVGKR
ncbi:tRNA (adenosine(37)-N6)-threonylcarbamoyltransferase complex dimerization subunit type 1 TsaB [Marinomonas algicola]|uniref:tRNA (adenosine(37)-N6)-threonylcarbamoyltransferase complex dimerization subunit type 1 TsaB n=1 Tax=Marinomonas algicola TaxID=2773454 RepID=UPI00174D48AE|nr:tRNA (adenosine(37)-N6)-threonylcarbamoyltransferase complex dimerization subunit type 1 TsaB [Marinomonas algicola]